MLHKNIPYRRHQDSKHKKEAVKRIKTNNSFTQYNNPFWGSIYWKRQAPIPLWEDKVYVGIVSKTPQNCSSYCCGNVPRKFGGDSLDEIRNALTAIDSLEEVPSKPLSVKNLKTKYEDGWSWD